LLPQELLVTPQNQETGRALPRCSALGPILLDDDQRADGSRSTRNATVVGQVHDAGPDFLGNHVSRSWSSPVCRQESFVGQDCPVGPKVLRGGVLGHG